MSIFNSIVQKLRELVYEPLGLNAKQGKALQDAVFRLAGELRDADGDRLFSKKGGYLSNAKTGIALDDNLVTDTVADKDGSVRHMKNVMDNLGGKQKKEPAVYANGKTAEEKLKRDEESFGKIVDMIDEQEKTELIPVMHTPLALQMVGAKDLPIKIRHSDLKKITAGKHGDAKSIENVKKLPSQMADPVAVFKSATRDDSYVMMLELTNAKGATYVAPVALEKTERRTGLVINRLTSAYGKGDSKPNNRWFASQSGNGKLLYVNTKKASKWSEGTGVQFPRASNQDDALTDSSVKHESDLVKLKNEYPTKYSLFGRGNGYHGWSKSNNAISAEEEGRFPATVAAKKLGVKAGAIKLYIDTGEWHHTGNRYNKTMYYDIADLLAYQEGGREALAEKGLDEEEIAETERLYNQLKEYKEPKKDEKLYRADVEYLEWGGTRSHPTAKKHTYENIPVREKGSFYTFTLPNGKEVRKKIGSNGTEVNRLPDIDDVLAHEEEYRETLSKAGVETLAFVKKYRKDHETSWSGTVYPKGKKPTGNYHDNPSAFFQKGDRILREDGRSAKLQEWTGEGWNTVEVSDGVTPSSLMYSAQQMKLITDSDKPVKFSWFKNPKAEAERIRKSNDTHNKKVKQLVERGTGLKIAWGHTNSDVVYDKENGVIRTREANNWRVTMPKVAEAYCAKLGIGIRNTDGKKTISPAMRDYVTEFILTGAINKAGTKEAAAFEKAMLKNESLADNILALQAEIFHHNALTQAEKASENIVYDTSQPSTSGAKGYAVNFVTKVFDEYFPLYLASMRLDKKYREKEGKALPANRDPYTISRNLRGIVSQAEQFVKDIQKEHSVCCALLC